MKINITNGEKTLKGQRVLDNINLEFESGKIYGLKGRNGSGKTMLMRAIAGLILLDKGQVEIDKKVIGKEISFPESIGVLIENPGFLGHFTGIRNLEMVAGIKGTVTRERLKQLMISFGLDPESKKKVKEYSLGMKQKLGIILALMEEPEILLLDEPFNALDEQSVIQVKELLKEYRNKDRVMIITSHDKEDLVSLSDEIFEMEMGAVVKRGAGIR